MKSIEEELRKLNAIEIKKQNPVLSKIASLENELIEAFNKDLKVIFGAHYSDIIKTISKNTPNLDNVKTRTVTIDGEQEPVIIPVNILQDFHKSYIENDNLRIFYEERLKDWFSEKTNGIKEIIKKSDTYQDLMKERDFSFALASLAITSFHQRPGIVLRKVQKRTGIAISEGNVAELASGEGKTLAAVLPAFLNALRGKGVHIVTANNYLSKRDYDELLPIYEGLGLSAGYLPKDEEELATLQGKKISDISKEDMLKLCEEFNEIHREAYKADITFGSSDTFAFDYLRDNTINTKEEMVQRVENPGCAIIDEIDDLLIDNGQTPYVISEKSFVY